MQKVVIVEKRKTIREGIKILINRFSEHECVETFESFQNFKDRIKSISPNVLLIDIKHKGISVIEEIRNLKSDNPSLSIIVLTMNEEDELVFDALANGAVAYVHKNAPSQKLVRVLEEAVAGRMLINSFIARMTVKYIRERKMTNMYQDQELKLLKMATEGNNLFAIEKSLKITVEDIQIYFRRIYDKLFENKKSELLGAMK